MEEGPRERLVMIQAKVDRMKMTGLCAKKKKKVVCAGVGDLLGKGGRR